MALHVRARRSIGEITELCKWTVVRIEIVALILCLVVYRLSETGLGLLATIPKLCHEPHRSGVLYGYVKRPYEAVVT